MCFSENLFSLAWFSALFILTSNCLVIINNDTKNSEFIYKNQTKYSISELLHKTFPKKVSNDLYLDPCKFVTVANLREKVNKFQLPPKFKEYKNRRKRAVTARYERIWDYGVIPYEIDDRYTSSQKALFKQAMKHWENYTCIKFVPRVPEDHPNFIIFNEMHCGCCSFVGKKGKGQAISIGKDCDRFGVVIHELGHVIGFWHEHTRPDRDNYIRIIKENIMHGQEDNFNKLTEKQVNALQSIYDYDSIMHYARNTFARGSYLDTIEPLKEDVDGRKPVIGQRTHLSKEDILQANQLYKCPVCGGTYQTKSGSFSPPNVVLDTNTPEKGMYCEWRIQANHGERISLNITKMDIYLSPNCTTDYLEIRDGYWLKSPVIGRYCGSESYEFSSNGSRLTVTYVLKNPQKSAGFFASYKAICGGDFYVESELLLESPNYPDEYQPNQECIWRIKVKDKHQAVLKFQAFDIEHQEQCVYDFLEIRDGLSADSPLIKKYCGHDIPSEITSTSNTLFVRFVSDKDDQDVGFSAKIFSEYNECKNIDHGCEQLCFNMVGKYECGCKIGYELHTDGKTCIDACGGVLKLPNDTIISPSFPEVYPAGKYCVWEIIAKPYHRITLNFTHFDLEGNDIPFQLCEFDTVQVTSQLNNGTTISHGTFCGPNTPDVITSQENVLRIEFTSDATVQKTGFAAYFQTYKDPCHENNGGCQHFCHYKLGNHYCSCRNGYIIADDKRSCKEDCFFNISKPFGRISTPNYPKNYPAKKDCVWLLNTVPGHRITISFLDFDLEDSSGCFRDFVNFYDGDNDQANSLGSFCGDSWPLPVISSMNQMYVHFKTDSSIQKKGFSATYATVCGGVFQAETERKYIISHPKFEKNGTYDNNIDCDWRIEAPGDNIRISFESFDLEGDQNCECDYVEIIDSSNYPHYSYGKFCGSNKPQGIMSEGDSLLVRFKTDDSMVKKGFKFSYELVKVPEIEDNVIM